MTGKPFCKFKLSYLETAQGLKGKERKGSSPSQSLAVTLRNGLEFHRINVITLVLWSLMNNLDEISFPYCFLIILFLLFFLKE
jgi:hypothetical protein